MADRSDQYRFTDKDYLTVDALNRRFLDINDRLSAAEVARLSEDQAFAVVLDRVLARSEDVIASLRNKLLQITELEWLTARSSTERTLANAAEFFLIIEEEDRPLFAPGPFAVLTREGSPDDYAVVKTLGFDRQNGRWDVQVTSFSGNPGPHSDWEATAIAGSTLAQKALLEQGRQARDEAQGVADSLGGVLADAQEVIDSGAPLLAARDEAVGAAGTATAKRNEAKGFRDEAEQFKNTIGTQKDIAVAKAAEASGARDTAVNLVAGAGALIAASLLSGQDLGTRAAWMAANVPAAITQIRTTGYATPGDGGDGLYVRAAAQPIHQGRFRSADRFMPTGAVDNANGGWWELKDVVPKAKTFGALLDGVSDDTAAINAAIAYLPANGGTVLLGPGKPTFNVVIIKSGVRLVGCGITKNQGAPSSNYWRPFDPNLPVVQIGNDTGYVSGCAVEDACIRGENVAKYGLLFGAGAYRNTWRNVQVQAFTEYCAGFVSGAAYPCVYNKGVGVQLTTSIVGGRTLYFEGKDNPNGYVTANTLNGYDITGPTGGFAVHVKGFCGGNTLGQGWIECGKNGGFKFEKTANIPELRFSGSMMDSPDSNDFLHLYLGEDLQGAGANTWRAISGDLLIDGRSIHSNTTTTGDIATGQPTLTVTSAASVWAGRIAWIVGAGTGGAPHVSEIKSVAGTTVTLKDAAAVTVVGATVYVGDEPGQPFRFNSEMVSTPALRLTGARHTRPRRPAEGRQLYASGGFGTLAPWNNFGLILDLHGSPWDILTDSGQSRTITSLTRVGTTVTCVFNAQHSVTPGTLLDIRGANEDGFNGVFAVTTCPDANTVTYTSPVNGAAVATGTFINQIVRRINLQYNVLTFDAGFLIKYRDKNGVANTVISGSTVNDNFFLGVPSALEGGCVLSAGTNASTSTAFSVDGGGVRGFQVNRYGSVGIGGNTPASVRGVVYLFNPGTDPSQTPTGGAFLWNNQDKLKLKTSLGVVGFVQTDLDPLKPPSFTTATAPAASANTGRLIYVTDGANGQPCLARSNGNTWLRIAEGAAISAT